LITFIVVLSLSPINASAVVSTDFDELTEAGLQSIFQANERLLNEMTGDMNQLLSQIEAINEQGGLPVIQLPLGIRINTFDLLRGFMNGINIPLLVNIGGIGRLNHALFNNFTYSTILSGSLGFPNGILNGSNTVNHRTLPQQNLEARIATQEYLLYVTDAIRGALRLVSIMDMNGNGFEIAELSDMLSGARTFLEFNMNDFNQRRNAMYQHFGPEAVTMGSIVRATRNVSDIVRSIDGGGYNLLIDVRNSLLGNQENVNVLVDILNYVERMTSDEVIEKYRHIDFTYTNPGIDQMFGYLIADVTEARAILEQFDRLTGPFATLLNRDPEGGIVSLILSFFGDDLKTGIGALIDDIVATQLPESLGLGVSHIMHDLLGDIDFNTLDTPAVLAYIDAAIFALEQMRSGVQDINLDQARQFVTEILSREILNKYYALLEGPFPRMGTLLRYIQNDIDGAIATLEFADLLDEELAPLLGGRRVSDVIKEYLIITIAHVINNELDSHITGLGDHGIGEIISELLAPVILNFDIPTTAHHLQMISCSLSYIIPVYDRLENLLLQGSSLSASEIAHLLTIAQQMKDETVHLIHGLITNQFENSRILQQLRDTATRVSRRIDSIRDVSQDLMPPEDLWQQIRERSHEMARAYREEGKSRVREFLSNSQLYNYLRNLFGR
jgi:hypothetical protein